jgi:hypothetical protein
MASRHEPADHAISSTKIAVATTHFLICFQWDRDRCTRVMRATLLCRSHRGHPVTVALCTSVSGQTDSLFVRGASSDSSEPMIECGSNPCAERSERRVPCVRNPRIVHDACSRIPAPRSVVVEDDVPHWPYRREVHIKMLPFDGMMDAVMLRIGQQPIPSSGLSVHP